MAKKFALIVAGGSGNRMNNSVPKQFIEINGLPILMHTFEAFVSFDSEFEFVLVLPESQVEFWEGMCEKYKFKHKYTLAFGGKNRFQSVRNGLHSIIDDGIVFIHDGVRPLVSLQTIQNCYDTTLMQGNALPVTPPSESIRYSFGNENKTVDRDRFFLVQTPQTFKVHEIKSAYETAPHQKFTDDASVLEYSGLNINLVEGNRENIKITWPQDLIIAKSYLSSQQ